MDPSILHTISSQRFFQSSRNIKVSKWTNKFSNEFIETIYQKYSYQERRTSLMIVIFADFVFQGLFIITLLQLNSFITWKLTLTIISFIVDSLLGLFCWKRCLKSQKLNWVALIFWINLITHETTAIDDFSKIKLLQFSVACGALILLPYSIFPVSSLLATIIGTANVFIATLVVGIGLCIMKTDVAIPLTLNEITNSFQSPPTSLELLQKITSHLFFFIAANYAGIYIKFVVDKHQRKCFLETLKFLEMRCKVQRESDKQEKLLFSILPDFVAKEILDDIKSKNIPSAAHQFYKIYVHRYDNVTILFADIKGFTALASKCSAQQLVNNLNNLFAKFDSLAKNNHCLRIKLLGDCYYCVSGLPVSRPDHAKCAIKMGLEMLKAIEDTRTKTEVELSMRIGIHSGSLLCGVLGLRKWQFDIWSHDVTIANRLEASGVAGRLHISDLTYQEVKDILEVEPGYGERRDNFFVKHNIKTYLVQNDQWCDTGPPSVITTPVPLLRNVSVLSIETLLDLPFKNLWTLECDCQCDIAFTDSNFSKNEYIDIITNQIEKNYQTQYCFLNHVTLKFHDDGKETQFNLIKTNLYRSNITCCVILWALLCICQLAVIPLNFYILGFFLFTTLILLLILGIAWSENCAFGAIKALSRRVNSSPKKMISLIAVIVILRVVTTLCIFFVTAETRIKSSGNNDSATHDNSEYIVLSWIICLVTNMAVLKLYFVVKLVMAVVMTASFTVIINIPRYRNIFSDSQEEWLGVSAAYLTLRILLVFCLLIYYNRIIEVTSRLYFLWKQKAEDELKNMECTKYTNMQLLTNILPEHLAHHFLSREFSNEELYSQTRDDIGVLFATIPNFSEFYTEQKDLECIRLLNEIIADFDTLLDDCRFACIEKIKTVSATATYMAVSGLNLTNTNFVDVCDHVSKLIDFAIAMQHKLNEINKDSFNKFRLKVGVSHGNLVCGVIGAKKPIFDIWGDTVNAASRMNSTGVAGHIQVTKNTAEILQQMDYTVRCRGLVDVKGKGLMETYFVINKKLRKPAQRYFSDSRSLGAMMCAIVENRQRFFNQTFKM